MKKSRYYFSINNRDQHRFDEYILRNKIDARRAVPTLFSSTNLHWADLHLSEVTTLMLTFEIRQFADIGSSSLPVYDAVD